MLLSAFVALVSAGIALRRWRDHRRKDRLDVYYARLVALRAEIAESMDVAALRDVAARIRGVEAEAFELLIEERVNADHAFVILVVLASEVTAEVAAEIAARSAAA